MRFGAREEADALRSSATARIHHTARRRRDHARLAARCAPAAGDAHDRIPGHRFGRPVGECLARVPPGSERNRLCRRPEPGDRIPLGGRPSRSIAGHGRRSGPPASGSDCDGGQRCGTRGKDGDQHDPNRHLDRQRSGAAWPRPQPEPAERQRHGHDRDGRGARRSGWN